MPLLTLNDEECESSNKNDQLCNEPIRKFRTNEEMGTSTLFGKDHSLDNIIKYVAGMRWEVDYFLQKININEQTETLDINLPVSSQKYHRINKLDIILESPINQDEITNITGDGIINAGFKPNIKDMFIATLTGGRLGLFTITEIALGHYNLHDTYKVSFKLVTFIDYNHQLYNNLIYKTVGEYTYDKNYIADFSAPIILKSEYDKKLNLKNRYKELVNYFFTKFINKEKRVISPPTINGIFVDNLLSRFVISLVNHDDAPIIYKLNRLDYTRTEDEDITSVWDMILNRDITMLNRVDSNIGFKYMSYNNLDLRNGQYNYLGLNFGISKLSEKEIPYTPEFVNISTKDKYFPEEKDKILLDPNIKVSDHSIDVEGLENIPNNDEGKLVIKDTKDVNIRFSSNEYVNLEVKNPEAIESVKDIYYNPSGNPHYYTYAFTDNFYRNDVTQCGILERNLLVYLDKRSVKQEELEIMLEQYHMWSTIEQFYYIPVLIVLVKDAIRRTFKSV